MIVTLNGLVTLMVTLISVPRRYTIFCRFLTSASVDVATIRNMKSSRPPILLLFSVLPTNCRFYRVNISVWCKMSVCVSCRLPEECDAPAMKANQRNNASCDAPREWMCGRGKTLQTNIKIKSKTTLPSTTFILPYFINIFLLNLNIFYIIFICIFIFFT